MRSGGQPRPDDPDLDYRDVPPEPQPIRGPCPIGAGITAYEMHAAQHPGPLLAGRAAEPIGDLPAAWIEMPEASYGVVSKAGDRLLPSPLYRRPRPR
jgi:hypothetical protein